MITLLIDHSSNRRTRVYKQKFDYNNTSWDDMNEFFTQYDFVLALNSSNTEFIWLFLKTAINSAFNLFVPKIPVKESNQPRCIGLTQLFVMKLSVSIPPKDNLQDTLLPGKDLKQLYSLQNKLQQMITEAKADYETNLALSYAHMNSNKIFQYIFSIKGQENVPCSQHDLQ